MNVSTVIMPQIYSKVMIQLICINQRKVEMMIIITEYYQLLQSLSLAHIVALRFKK